MDALMAWLDTVNGYLWHDSVLYVILGVIPDWDRGVTVLDLWGGVLATGYTDTFDDSVLIQDGADYLFPSD